MTRVGIREARSRLSELIERAARGEEIVITRRGEQVARLLPPERPELPELPVKWGQAHALAERIRRSRSRHALGGGVTIRALIDEGRR